MITTSRVKIGLTCCPDVWVTQYQLMQCIIAEEQRLYHHMSLPQVLSVQHNSRLYWFHLQLFIVTMSNIHLSHSKVLTFFLSVNKPVCLLSVKQNMDPSPSAHRRQLIPSKQVIRIDLGMISVVIYKNKPRYQQPILKHPQFTVFPQSESQTAYPQKEQFQLQSL